MIQNGPGAELGNLYYFTWASFLTAFMLLANCVEDYNTVSTNTNIETPNDLEMSASIPSPESNGVPSP